MRPGRPGTRASSWSPRPTRSAPRASRRRSALGSSTGDQTRSVGLRPCRPYSTLTQYRYPFAERKYDKRAAYYNPNFPWIEAVYAFQHKHHHALQFDTASFEFPRNREGSGQYIVHWMWRGYYNCIDVDVQIVRVVYY